MTHVTASSVGQLAAYGWRYLVAALLVAAAVAVPAPAQAAGEAGSISRGDGSGQATEVGTAFATQMSVAVFDGSNALLSGVEVVFSAPTSGASGTFAGGGTTVSVNTNSTGLATAPVFTANDVEGDYLVTAAVDGSQTTTGDPLFSSFSLSNTSAPATAAHTISMGGGSGQAAQVGTAFATQMSVAVFDGSNALLSGVEVVFSAPTSGASGTFAGGGTTASVNTNSTGLATAPVFTANDVEGDYLVTAAVDGSQTTTGDPLTTSFALTNTLTDPNGVPSVISTAGGTGQQALIGDTFAAPITVFVFDGAGNPVPGAAVRFEAPISGPSVTFAGGDTTDTVNSDSTGGAVSSPFTANLVAGSATITVTASKDGVSAAIPVTFTNTAVGTRTELHVAPTGSTLVGDPVTMTADVVPTSSIVEATGPVSFRANGATITGCAAVTPVAGLATCTVLELTPGTFDLTANYAGDASTEPSVSAAVSHTVEADTTAPAVVVTGPSTVEADSASGAVVTYDASASDDVSEVTATCLPESGTEFPIGTTTVTCSATDDAGNTAGASLVVTVVDTTSPVVVVPEDRTAAAEGAAGTVVDFVASASDTVDGEIAADCVPGSGTTFAPGMTTTVTCSATDHAGNTGEASFTVTIGAYAPPTGDQSSGDATVTLSVSTARPGEEIEVRGSGFAPGETLQATLNSEPVDLGRHLVDSAGTVRFTVTIPTTVTSGDHVVRLVGRDSKLRAEADLRIVAAPTPVPDAAGGVLPNAGAPASTGMLAWGGGLALLGGLVLRNRSRRAGAHDGDGLWPAW